MSRRPLRQFIFLFATFALALTGCGRGPLYDRGVEALQNGEDVAARAYLEKAISQQPGSSNNAQAHNLVGVACWRLGEREHARQAFENSRNIDPTLAVAAYNLGVLTAATTNYTQAAALFHEAALLDQSDPRPLEYLAHLATTQGQWTEAGQLLEQALSRDPLSARVLTALALTELRTRDPQTALARLGAAIDADPDYGPAYLNLAVLASHWLKKDAEAVVWLDKYLALEEADGAVEQVVAWRAALAADLPQDPDEGGGISLTGTQPPPVTTGEDQAVDAELQAQAAVRRQAALLCNEGTVALARRQWDKAIAAYRAAVRKDPTFDLARLNLAKALHEAGKDVDAVVELRKIAADQPNYARAQYQLGLIFSAQEQTHPEAVKHYRKFLELRPNDAAAERITAWLEQVQ